MQTPATSKTNWGVGRSLRRVPNRARTRSSRQLMRRQSTRLRCKGRNRLRCSVHSKPSRKSRLSLINTRGCSRLRRRGSRKHKSKLLRKIVISSRKYHWLSCLRRRALRELQIGTKKRSSARDSSTNRTSECARKSSSWRRQCSKTPNSVRSRSTTWKIKKGRTSTSWRTLRTRTASNTTPSITTARSTM